MIDLKHNHPQTFFSVQYKYGITAEQFRMTKIGLEAQ